MGVPVERPVQCRRTGAAAWCRDRRDGRLGRHILAGTAESRADGHRTVAVLGGPATISYFAVRETASYNVVCNLDSEFRHGVSPMMTISLPSLLSRLARPPRLVRVVALAAVACAALAGSAVTTPANAWCCGGGWHGGVFIGIPPIVVGPPVYPYYAPPPPAYYPPPPGYYAPPPTGYAPPPTGYAPPPTAYAPPSPPQSDGQSGGQSCTAGPYVCPMDHPVASGSSCYCLGNNRTQVW